MYLSREKRAALKMANKVRKDYGYSKVKKLKPGTPGHNATCPIARTINEGLRPSVTGGCITVGSRMYINSPGAADFIGSFDNGRKHQDLKL